MGLFAKAALRRDEIALQREEIALKRDVLKARKDMLGQIKNSGYDHSGASTQKKSLRGWVFTSKSPQEDIDPNLNTLRQRSRDLYTSAPIATSAIKTKKTNVVGSGLTLRSKINYKVLGLTQNQAKAWQRHTQMEFEFFAASRWCDALRLNNFYELQALAFMSWQLNGDGFALVRYDDPTKWMPYSLRLHLIEADRVSTPGAGFNRLASFVAGYYNTIGRNSGNGNAIYNGVEIDSNGAVVAYWICNQYPNSFFRGAKKEWKRVEAFGKKTGNPNILHLIEQERCEQYRGVPFLAPVIEHLKQISRYTEAELMAAVVQAYFTAFITTTDPATKDPFSETVPDDEKISKGDPDEEVSYEMGSGTVNVMRPGESVTFADPKRPSSGFEMFVSSMAKQIGAGLEIPYELLMKSFTASYSASRAALLEAWKSFFTTRSWFVSDFCQPTYEMWLAEAVAIGRIDAPGFFNDPVIRAAWSRAEWTGPTQGQIDPVKEVTAAILRVGEGFSTREQETMAQTGGDWDNNIEQITLENELLRAASGSSVSPAVGTGNEPSDEGEPTNKTATSIVNTILKNMIERSLVESE